MNLKKDTEKQLRHILQEQADQAVPDNTDSWTALHARLNRLEQTKSLKERISISVMPIEVPVKPTNTERAPLNSTPTTKTSEAKPFRNRGAGPQRLILSGLTLVVVLLLGVVLLAALALPKEGRSVTPNVAANPTPAVTGPISGATVAPSSATVQPSGSVLGSSSRLVYETRDLATNRSQIYLVQNGANGPSTTKIGEGTSPIFSSDGSRVAYLVKTSAPAGVTPSVDNPASGKISLVSVRIDGSDTQEYCTTGPGANIGLVGWQPDGQSIVWWLSQENSSTLQVCNLATKQSSPLKLPSDTSGEQLLSFVQTTDGKHALWQASDRSATAARYSSRIFFGDPTRPQSEATQLTSGQYAINGSSTQPELAAYQSYLSASISPDGKTIAIIGSKLFFVAVPGQQSALAGKSFDYTAFAGDTWLTRSGAFHPPVWSADSQSILYIDQNGTIIRALNLSTGATNQVAVTSGQIYNLSFFLAKG